MHDCYDHMVALTHLFQEKGKVRSLFDLQLAQEALTGDTCNTMRDALNAFGACDNIST